MNKAKNSPGLSARVKNPGSSHSFCFPFLKTRIHLRARPHTITRKFRSVSTSRSLEENIIYVFNLTSTAKSSMSWMVCEMGSKWAYNCSFVGCCFQDLFNAASLSSCHLAFSPCI